MSSLRRFLQRCLSLVRPGQQETDLQREIDAHLDLIAAEFAARGLSPEEARLAARRAFGGVEQAKELQRDARSFRMLAGWPMDLRLGARMLAKSPGLTAVAVVALAVAICGGAAGVEFVGDLYNPSLRLPAADRLAGMSTIDARTGNADLRNSARFLLWRQSLRSFEELGAFQSFEPNLFTADGRTEPVRAAAITASAFRIAGAAPMLGRTIDAADEKPGSPGVAVISERLWNDRFARASAVVGQTARLDRNIVTIIGVMPDGFGFPVNQNLWTALQLNQADAAALRGPAIRVFGRLAPGVTRQQAQAEIDAVSRSGVLATPADETPQTTVLPYVRALTGGSEAWQQSLAMYAVGLFFLGLLGVCAANVATLVFGRTVTRETEITVRAALGASRGRIVSQLITEALVMSVAAAAVGLAAASFSLRWARTAWETGQGEPLPFWWNESLGADTLLYVGLLVIVTAVIIGGLPALKATGRSLQGRLKSAGAGSTMTFGRLWTGVVVSQVGLTVFFLLTVVGLAQSVVTIDRQYSDVAFTRSAYLTAMVSINAGAAETGAPTEETGRRIQAFADALAADPSVADVTYTTRLPAIDQELTAAEVGGRSAEIRKADIGPNFFRTFSRPMIAGRDFSGVELAQARAVAIVDESFVRFVLGGANAVGQTIRLRDRGAKQPGPPIEIVGVVGDMSTAARKSVKDATVYRPIGLAISGAVNVVVHSAPGQREPGLPAVVAAVRRATSAAPAGTRVSDIYTLDSVGGGDAIGFIFTSLSVVGAVALLLSTAGIYALISFTLARRTREIGLRVALGASPRRIITGLLSKSFIQIGCGVLAGAIPGAGIVAVVAGQSSGRSETVTGVAVAAGVSALVLLVALVSCTVPLRRALRLQPTQALRTEQ